METPPFIVIWRCLSYWTWGFSKVMFVFGGVFCWLFVFFAAKVRWIPGGFFSRTGWTFFSGHFWVFIGLFFWVDPLQSKGGVFVCLCVFFKFFLQRESSHQWPDRNQVAEVHSKNMQLKRICYQGLMWLPHPLDTAFWGAGPLLGTEVFLIRSDLNIFPNVGGHQQPLISGHLTIRKSSQTIARHWNELVSLNGRENVTCRCYILRHIVVVGFYVSSPLRFPEVLAIR